MSRNKLKRILVQMYPLSDPPDETDNVTRTFEENGWFCVVTDYPKYNTIISYPLSKIYSVTEMDK